MLEDGHETPGAAVAAVVLYLLEDQCIDIDYDRIIESDRQTGWDDISVVNGFRQYSYMACTQVIYRGIFLFYFFFLTSKFNSSSVGITHRILASNHTVQVSQLNLYSKLAKMSSVTRTLTAWPVNFTRKD